LPQAKKKATPKPAIAVKLTAASSSKGSKATAKKKAIVKPAARNKPAAAKAGGEKVVKKSSQPATKPTKKTSKAGQKQLSASKPAVRAPKPAKKGPQKPLSPQKSNINYEENTVTEKKAKSGKTVNSKQRAEGADEERDLPEAIRQGLSKGPQRKRGWRDIEALTERARLKSMLVDIWHEDIDLDSDIFGESDHASGYYTDKEEEIEVEDDEDDDWEEVAEEES
jgi:hypothetical protein